MNAELEGIPTPVCPMCGSQHFKMVVMFDPVSYEIAAYGLKECECYSCGCKVTPPTPLDLPEDRRLI